MPAGWLTFVYAFFRAPLSALEAAAFLGRQATAVVPRQALARGCA